jgi:hypothetical protein
MTARQSKRQSTAEVYQAQAIEMLTQAKRPGGWQEGQAMAGVGWALLALLEQFKQERVEIREQTNQDGA